MKMFSIASTLSNPGLAVIFTKCHSFEDLGEVCSYLPSTFSSIPEQIIDRKSVSPLAMFKDESVCDKSFVLSYIYFSTALLYDGKYIAKTNHHRES